MQYSDLQEILYTAAVRAGVQVIFDTKVSFAEPPCHPESSDNSSPSPPCGGPSVHLSDGTILEADMIIGADGQHSTVRLSVEEKDVKPRRTGTIVLVLVGVLVWSTSMFYGYVIVPDRISRIIHHVLGYPIVGYRRVKSECD